jgi:alpha-beta hydrolase superfamily lysophospholipase
MTQLWQAILIVVLLSGCGGAELEPWHTVELTEEFSADKSNEIDSFDAYLALEERLFAQLDREVYATTGVGPEYTLFRYSSGSAADPRNDQPDWNRSFELNADSPIGGVLLLHGMSDSPYSLRALGQTLQQRGYQVLGLRLPGHGTAPSGLTHVTWQEMAAAVRLAMKHLHARLGNKPIHIIGYSTGAPLALNFVLDDEEGGDALTPASLVLISPAIGISPAAAVASWKRRLSMLPGLGRLAWLSIDSEFDPYKYNSFATNAAEQVHRLTRSVSARIATRASAGNASPLPPILVLKSTVDATVSTSALVDRLLMKLSPGQHELVLFDINRLAIATPLLVSDPAPLTARLLADEKLPFGLTLVSNINPDSNAVGSWYRKPFSGLETTHQPLQMAWPRGVISLSHVALPFAPEDPLYGQYPPLDKQQLFLGQMSIKGERGLLKISTNWLLRMRYNPFYNYLEQRVLQWLNPD